MSKLNDLSANELARLAVPLTEEEIEHINTLFAPYIFYQTVGSGKDCYCSACRKHFYFDLPRLFTEQDRELLDGRHGNYAKCPECGIVAALKCIGTVKNAGNLWQEIRFVIPQIINKNAVLLRCYYAHKNYSADAHYIGNAYRKYDKGVGVDYKKRFCSEPVCQLSKVYLLQPGSVQCARLDDYFYNPQWHTYNSSREPFRSMFGARNDYYILDEFKLAQSFMKYAAIYEYRQMFHPCGNNLYARGVLKYVTFLCRSAELPALEILTKLGYAEVVSELVYKNEYHKRYVNWHGKTPWEIFKLPKAEYKILETYAMKSGSNQQNLFYVLQLNREFKKYGIKGGIQRACSVTDRFGIYYFEIFKPRIYRGEINLTHLENYISKFINKKRDFKGLLAIYRDYLRFAQDLNYDLTAAEVLFPKHLIKAHDAASKNLALIAAQKAARELEEKQKAAAEYLKKYTELYEYAGEEFSIIVPQTALEIIAEGQAMHHCVGGYAARHLEGKLCICFLRRNAEPDKAFYTIEMHGKKLQQIQGYHNQHPISEQPEAEAFFNEWLAWVKAGSKRKKAAAESAA